MSKLTWDNIGERFYETGVDHGVLYKYDPEAKAFTNGVPWNGLSSVAEKPSGAEETAIYADNIKYLSLFSKEEFGATVEAYTYPDEFAECDGSANIANGVTIGQQTRKMFGLAFRTILGNDTENDDYGYKLHLIYNCKASPSERTYATVNDSPEAITFSWEITTTAADVPGYKATANITIDSKKADATKLAALEAILYGVDAEEFSDTKTYAVGEYVTHTDKTYVCKVAVETAGAWDDTNWEEVTNLGPRLPLPEEVMKIMANG